MVVLALGGAGLEAVLGGYPQVGRARVENDLTGEEGREGGKEGERENEPKQSLERRYEHLLQYYCRLPFAEELKSEQKKTHIKTFQP
jgi:hypothetical protein